MASEQPQTAPPSPSGKSASEKSSPEDNQNHFVIMVKECIDSPFALTVMQSISTGDISIADLLNRVSQSDSDEVTRIIQKVKQYTLVEQAEEDHQMLRLTHSGREFLSILADIERLKSRYNN